MRPTHDEHALHVLYQGAQMLSGEWHLKLAGLTSDSCSCFLHNSMSACMLHGNSEGRSCAVARGIFLSAHLVRMHHLLMMGG